MPKKNSSGASAASSAQPADLSTGTLRTRKNNAGDEASAAAAAELASFEPPDNAPADAEDDNGGQSFRGSGARSAHNRHQESAALKQAEQQREELQRQLEQAKKELEESRKVLLVPSVLIVFKVLTFLRCLCRVNPPKIQWRQLQLSAENRMQSSSRRSRLH